MQNTIPLRIDKPTHRKLKMIAAHEGGAMVDQIRVMVNCKYAEIFDVVGEGELPHPEDAEPVKVLYIQKRDAA